MLKIFLLLVMLAIAAYAADSMAEPVPSWIKSTTGLWVSGEIDDSAFVNAIQHLVANGIIAVSEPAEHSQSDSVVPDWVKTVAELWVADDLADDDFLNAVQYMIGAGIIVLAPGPDDTHDVKDKDVHDTNPQTEKFQDDLAACSEIKKAYKRIECENAVKDEMLAYQYRSSAQRIDVGPVTYYWHGIDSEGNGLEISSSGQALLSIRMFAENTSPERVSLNCTSPQICNYDVTDGSRHFKYSGMDFTNGQIVLDPGQSREFNILFGPNIGYGGTEFVYDPAKEYYFRISESYGRAQVPLELGTGP